jgi:hypothetical protein
VVEGAAAAFGRHRHRRYHVSNRPGAPPMNALLDKALHRVAELPDAEQEAIASLILDEIEAERGWRTRFAATQDALGELVKRAKAEVAETESL